MKIVENLMAFRRAWFPYLIALLIAGLGVLLWIKAGPEFGLISLPVLCCAFLLTRKLVLQLVKANEQKLSLDRQLIQSQKLAAIGELSSGIAHEINNPLAIIGQEVEWMKHQAKDAGTGGGGNLAEFLDSLMEIGKQVDRCREITHKLLDFARKREPLIQTTDINKLVEDMVRLVEREAVKRKIKIDRDYRPDLPVVQTDAPQLRQVVLNLLINANAAIDAGGCITVATRVVDNGYVELSVSDTGCGIPEENRDKIFDPFFTTKPPGKGTGLGLSICHGIITKLDGRITVASEVGKGTTFAVRLPIGRRKGTTG